jgi:hypothetical protein
VSFWDLQVCKRSLGDFLWVFLVLKVNYEGLKVYDSTMCIILRFWCCDVRYSKFVML